MAIIDKQYLGVAAEYAVAAEFCRRNIYAQLTLGTRKRTDLLVDTEQGMLRIQVKAKQGAVWPNCRGTWGDNMVLFLVDFARKREDERPDFYILTSVDWMNLVNAELGSHISAGKVVIDNENVPVWVTQLNRYGQPYKGMGVQVSQVSAHKECWEKIKTMVSNL